MSAIVATATAGTVHAQERGDRGLFGGGLGNATQSLTLNGMLAETYLESLGGAPLQGLRTGETLPRTLTFGQAIGQARYSLALPWVNVSAGAGAFATYYRREWRSRPTYQAALGARHTWDISPRTRASLNVDAGIQPTYWATTAANGLGVSLADLNAATILPPDVSALGGGTAEATATARLTHDLSRRVSVDAGAITQRRWEFGRDDTFAWITHEAVAGLNVGLTQHLSARVGYRVQWSKVARPDADYRRSQGVDAALDYSRGGALVFRLTRRTTVTASGGLGATAGAAASDANADVRQRYFLRGDVRLTHEMGRTWQTSVGYDRSLEFSSLFAEPFLRDTLTASLGGLVSRRVSFSSVAAYTKGAVGFTGIDNDVTYANAAATLQVALLRHLAMGTTYAYFYRSIEPGVVTPLSRQSEGQLVTVYLNTWAPVFSRGRRSNASR